MLNNLENHYRNNQLVTTKDSAIHLLSGKRVGGLAYVGSLCNNSTNFGVSGGLYGTFNINNPQIVWDAKVIAHELGHNFGAMHTHTYSPQPIDCCYFESTASACANYEPYTQLPGLNSLTGGEPEKGTGTIMSYCHKVTGKLNNISLTLGRNHPYGIEADRVPDSMRATLLSAKQYYPQCLATYFPGFSRGILWSTNQIPSNNTLVTEDFNGDKKTDLIDLALAKNSDIYVSLSNTYSFINRKIWLGYFPINKNLPLVGDINGDGKDDLIKLPTDYKGLAIIANSNGESFKTTQQWMLTKPEAEGQYILGDFNGDKKSDLGFLAKNSKSIYVANSNGESFSSFKIWLSNINYTMDNINLGDFNGDRKYDISFTDLVKPKAIYVLLSSGKNFKSSRLWAKSANENYNLKAADFNADGLADLFYTNATKLNVMLSNKTSFEPSQEVGTFNNQTQTRFYTGKFDVDNAADILSFNKATTAILEVMPSLIR